MSKTYDILIVGAGIVGVSCALEFVQAGLTVGIMDQAPAGSGATAAGMGHLLVLDGSAAEIEMSRYANELWRQLEPELPPNCAFNRCGTIWMAEDSDELAAVAHKQQVYEESGLSVELLTPDKLRKHEPNLNTNLAGGLLVNDDSIVYAPAVTDYLLQKACGLGAAFLPNHRVVTIDSGTVTLDSGDGIEAGIVVNAAGHWAAALTPGLPVIPRKGHLMITDRYPGYVNHELIELGYVKSAHSSAKEAVAFNVQPRPTGQLLLGSTRQFGDESDEIRPHILQKVLKRIQFFLPEIHDLNIIRCWTGFRAATPDKLPLIGPWPEDPKLYLATGHEGLGITLALPTAKLLAAQIVNTSSEISITPYLPSRVLKENTTAHA